MKLSIIPSNRLLLISIVLVISFNFSSCRIYKSPMPFKELMEENYDGIVQVRTDNGDAIVYEKIIVEEGIYYGIRNINGTVRRTKIDPDRVVDVRKRNKRSSLFYNGIGIIVVAGSLFMGSRVLGW